MNCIQTSACLGSFRASLPIAVLVGVLGFAGCGGGGGDGGGAPPPTNNPPVANAGSDQAVSKLVVVTLNGSRSSDPDSDVLSFFWAQTSGTPVALSSPAAAQPSFTTPDATGSLVFSLYVNDGKTNSNVDTVTITVINNYSPVANAGAPATYNGGETAALDGTASSDPDGDPIAGYYWTQVSGTPVSLNNPRAAKPIFAVPNVSDTLTFSLIVSDGKAQSIANTVAVTCLSYSGSAVVLQGNPFGESLDLPDRATDVAVSGNHAYVTDSAAGLKIVDVSNPVRPSLVGTYDTPGSAKRIAMSGTHAYVADHDGGLQIIDVSNPTAPSLAGSYALAGVAVDVAVSGTRAFVTASDGSLNSLEIIDVSNPANPTLIGRYESACGPVNAVAVLGDFAYLAGGCVAGLHILDISNIASPSVVGYFGSVTPVDLVVVGNLVFLADWDQGLKIIDVSNAAVPFLVGSFNTASPLQASSIFVSGGHAYLAAMSGMHVVNISNVSTPQLEGTYRIAHLSLWTGVAVVGQYAYLADGNFRFQIIDVSIPSFSSVISSVATPGIAVGLALSGQHVFLAEGAHGMQTFNGMEIFDVSDPSSPSLAARFATPAGMREVALANHYAYLPLYLYGIAVVDISNASSPSLEAVIGYDLFYNPIPNDIDVVGNVLYTISDHFRIIDVADLTNPTVLGGDTLLAGSHIKIAGNLAYATKSNSSVDIIDISNPANLSLIGTLSGFIQVEIAGRYAYATEGNGFQIFDVSNPANPIAIGSFGPADGGIVVAGNYIYMPNGFRGTRIIDISDPSAPFLAGRHDVPVTTMWVAVDADNIYIAANENGFAIAERAPTLNTRYVEGSAGGALGYTVGWRDRIIPANVHVRCQVTGGTCAVTGIDQVGNTASVQWSLPSTPGHYEILFTVGNWQHFVTTKDRVIAH